MKKNKLQNQLRRANAAGNGVRQGGKMITKGKFALMFPGKYKPENKAVNQHFDFSGYWFNFSKIMSHCENLNLKKRIPFLKNVLDKLHPLTYRKRISDPITRKVDIANGGDGRYYNPWPMIESKVENGILHATYVVLDDETSIEKLKHEIEGEIERIERELKESSFHCFDPKKVEELSDGIFYDIASLVKILSIDKTTLHSFIKNGFQDSSGKKIGFEELEKGSVLRINKLYKIKGSVIKKMIAAGIID